MAARRSPPRAGCSRQHLRTATINNTVSSAKPTIVRATLSAGFGGMLQCSVKGTGQTSQTVKADISAELVLEA